MSSTWAASIRDCGPLEAVKELNQAFHLGINLEAPVDTVEAARAREAGGSGSGTEPGGRKPCCA